MAFGKNCKFIFAIIPLVILTLLLDTGQCFVPKEYEIKAAFIAQFVPFVKWPDSAHSDRPFIFAVVGEDPFGNALRPVEKEKFKGRKAKLKYFRSWKDLSRNIDVLFISRSEQNHIKEILEKIKGSPVLTVSDIRGFAKDGGMIEFVNRDGTIHFIINIAAVKKAGLEMNFQLLELADKVLGK
ncbi:MAG: YfiR family protein [Thermodesulfobacteria bacterium]|nr:YfiR family protein [Thermodesulfobacteriota bacterium]